MQPKVITLLSIIVIVGIITVAGWVVGIKIFYTKQPNQNMTSDLIKVEKNGFSFSYQKNLEIQDVGSTEENYANYRLTNTNSTVAPGDRSIITVSIPLKNTSNVFTLADSIKHETDPSKIVKTTLNGHQGDSITYRLDTNYPGDRPVHAYRTQEYYDTKFETSPLILDYIKYDTDASLDNYWDTIRQSIKY